MLDGAPLPAAVVTFHDPEGKINPCSGVTDSQGKFKLGFGSYDGAMPGKYKVTIEHLTKPDGSPLESQPGMDAMQLKLQGLAVQSLPAIYSDLSQTQLVAVVEKGSPKPTNFELTKKGA